MNGLRLQLTALAYVAGDVQIRLASSTTTSNYQTYRTVLLERVKTCQKIVSKTCVYDSRNGRFDKIMAEAGEGGDECAVTVRK